MLPHQNREPWRPSLDMQLIQLWTSGKSILTIAMILRAAGHDISHNAVAGRRRRLQLPERGSPIYRARSAQQMTA